LNESSFGNKAKVINTAGSVENMLLIANKKADIAFVQSDALQMLNIFYQSSGKTQTDLVDIVNKIYQETVHIIVSQNSKIKTMEDLNGKIMSAGGKNSGSSVTASYITQQYNINFASIVNKNVAKSLKLLDNGEIDVLFYVSKKLTPDMLKSKIRLLEVTKDMKDNQHIKKITLSKKTYKFLKKDVKTYGIDTLVIVKKGFKYTKKVKAYLSKFNKKAYKHIKKVRKLSSMIKIPKNTLVAYTKKYGNNALIRINYLNKKLSKLNDGSVYEKLAGVHNLVNKLHYIDEKKHWRKDNYWAVPLQFTGTGLGDSEDFALMKFLFLVKLGIEPSALKLIKLNKNLEVKDKNKENIALAYFHKNSKEPIIMEYSRANKKIYKAKKDIKYKILTKSINRKLNKIFTKNFSIKDVNKILGIPVK
jgi:TRAP transporter TAXI family solute receptor